MKQSILTKTLNNLIEHWLISTQHSFLLADISSITSLESQKILPLLHLHLLAQSHLIPTHNFPQKLITNKLKLLHINFTTFQQFLILFNHAC